MCTKLPAIKPLRMCVLLSCGSFPLLLWACELTSGNCLRDGYYYENRVAGRDAGRGGREEEAQEPSAPDEFVALSHPLGVLDLLPSLHNSRWSLFLPCPITTQPS